MAESHPVVSHPYAATLIRIKARQLCRRTDFTRCEVEDLQQSMWAYLIEKAVLYDPARGNLEAFITTLVNTWVGMELRRRSREKRRQAHYNASLDTTMVKHEGDEVPLGATLGEADLLRRLGRQPESQTDRYVVREAILHAVKQLSAEQQELLADVLDSDITTAAERHGVSPSTVRRRLNKMREAFRDAGFNQD